MRQWLIVLLCFLSPPALAQQGAWEPQFPFGVPAQPGLEAIVAVHLIHLHTGKVLAITHSETMTPVVPSCGNEPCAAITNYTVGRNYVWTPSSTPGNPGQFLHLTNCRNYMFCCGHSALADGRILLPGSAWAYWCNAKLADLFTPDLAGAGPVWNFPEPPPNMANGRWYPTSTTLPDGKVLVCAGTIFNGPPTVNVTIPELYDPASNSWMQLPSAERPQSRYPFMFVLPDGNLVDAGPGESRILITSPTSLSWTWGAQPLPGPLWHPTDPPPPPPSYDGSAAMYEPGKIVRSGGQFPISTATTYVVDLSRNPDPDNPPPWMYAASMNRARMNHTLVILPDGKVLAVGGNERYVLNQQNQWVPINPVLEAELFDPASATWTLMAASHIDHPRMYHSTAMLLRDGRVVSAGGDGFATGQIFRPPYITSGAPRPIITSAPTYMEYGEQYTITYNANGGPEATKACLIRLAAVTHGFDQDQRRGSPAHPRRPSPAQSCSNRAAERQHRTAGLVHAVHLE